MHRSQLRLLARDHALGQIEHAEYRQRRSDLIDGIVSGAIAIRREPLPPAAGSDASPVARALRGSPIHIAVGIGVVAALIWAALPDRATRTLPPPDPAPTAASERMPAARALVEGFLRERNWSEENLARFKASWNALTPNEQAQARDAAWFRTLAAALREEINAHSALAEFDGTGNASATGRRLSAFGEFLGIGTELPELGATRAAPPPLPAPPEVAREPRSQPEAPPPTTSGEGTSRRPSGSEWLAARADDDLTLQLFAANHLDRLEALIAAHPEIELQLLVFEHNEPRYRLVHGVFPTRDAAERGYSLLPPDLAGAERPLVRRIADLRRGVVAADGVELAEPRYTLQVFASASRENVERLLGRYPSLDMRVRARSDADAGFRVLIGEFDSPEAARAAADALPPTLIEELGAPLVRPLE